MKYTKKYALPALLLCAATALAPTQTAAEDIDIFTGAGGGAGADPKILIILDNTSNWSRQSQQWPGISVGVASTFSASSTTVTTTGSFTASGVSVGMQVTGTGIAASGAATTVASIESPTSLTLSRATTAAGSSVTLTFTGIGLAQGQSEVRAINTVLGSIGADVNMGMMEFVTGGTASDTGGFIRRAIKPMTDANKTAFSTELTTIFNNIGDPDEKRNANTEYGNLMRDAYNYFSGGNSVSPSAVLASKADPDGYTTAYSTFRSPLSDANSCGRNFIIFIGNPNSNGPAADDATNSAALTSPPLNCSVSPQLKVPGFTTALATTSTNLGYTSQCYASLAACSTADYAAQAGSYDSLSCSNTLTTTNLDTCISGTQRYSVTGNRIFSDTTTTAPAVITAPTNTSVTTGCYTSAETAAGDHGGMSLPTQTVVTTGTAPNLTTTTTTYSNDTYVIGARDDAASASCTPSVGAAVLGSNQITNTSALSTSCYSGTNTGNNKWNNSTDYGTLSCPTTSIVDDGAGHVTTTTYTCSYSGVLSADATGCSGSEKHVTVTQAATGSPSTVTTTPRYKFAVTQTVTASAVAVTTTGAVSTPTLLGNTTQCYASTISIPEFASTCATYNGGCTYSAPTASAGLCTSGARYMVLGNKTGTVVTPTGSFITPSTAANADEWASCLHKAKSINPASSPADTIKQTITTYTIDVFNAQQNAEETQLYMSMARVGGGKYFAATNEAAIVNALKSILNEIQSVNTTFASASLPVNATNRTQNANQVFIGMFRPDPDANPRWFGNLKQYAIGKVGGDLDLVDKNGAAATNALTGFIDDCAASFWTTDSNNYWNNIVVNPDPASTCTSAVASGTVYSDLPDGPTVEKGAVAEILRRGNTPGGATTQTTANRTVLTLSGSSLVDFDTTNVPSGTLAANVVEFTQGKDVNNATGLYDATSNPTQTRPSIHGDVVHSRPLPVNYGGTAGVTVYYGANDGTLRAVDASNGKERWAYVAPEHYSKLTRLKDNTPPVDYKLGTSGATAKDYFFDGSIGIYQAAAVGTNPPVWIYPTQRRGGRMVYAFDVSDPTANPTLKWRQGCPNLSNDTDCTAGFSQIGQTWSTPNVAFINGYSPDKTTKPVVVMGGGYDSCEDNDIIITTQCDSTKGNIVYILDAETGALIASFATTRAVAADVNMIDLNNDGLVDYAYVADVGGNIYRIDFVASPSNPVAVPNDTSGWRMHRIAYTNSIGQGRKFLFGPGLFASGTSTFLAIVSGDREHPLIGNYPYTSLPYPNKAYVYKDDLTSTTSTPATDLDLDPDMLDVTSASASTCTSTNLLTAASKKGWYMYLNANGQGEQGVTSAVIVGGMVTFSTNRPLSSALSCNTRLGEARGYFVNLFNASGSIGTANNASCGGSRSVTFAGGGLPPSPVIGIVPIDGQPTAVLIGAPPRDGGGASPIKPTKINPPIAQTRSRTYKYIKGDN